MHFAKNFSLAYYDNNKNFVNNFFEKKEIKNDKKMQLILLKRTTNMENQTIVNSFCHQGDFWEITYNGEKQIIKHIKGLEYIAYLLKNKERNISITQLYRIFELSSEENSIPEIEEDSGQESTTLDENEIEEYNQRLQELKIQEKKLKKQGENIDEIKEEIEFIKKKLKKGTGIKQKSRQLDYEIQQQTKTIHSAINFALDRIAKHHNSLGIHLSESIKTGTQYSYSPQQKNILWKIE